MGINRAQGRQDNNGFCSTISSQISKTRQSTKCVYFKKIDMLTDQFNYSEQWPPPQSQGAKPTGAFLNQALGMGCGMLWM